MRYFLSIMIDIEQQLKQGLTDAIWKALKHHCIENGIALDASALDYGSSFLDTKLSFTAGWEEAIKYTEAK